MPPKKPRANPRGRPPLFAGIRRCISITDDEDRYLKQLGHGSRSLGIRTAAHLLENVYKHTP